MKTYSRLGPELTEVLSQGTYNLHGDIGNAGFISFRLESFRTCGLSQEAMNFSSLFSVSTVYFDILCSGSFFLGIPRKRYEYTSKCLPQVLVGASANAPRFP